MLVVLVGRGRLGGVRGVRRPDGGAVGAGDGDAVAPSCSAPDDQLRQDGAAVEREDLRGDGGQVAQQAGAVVGRLAGGAELTDLRDEVLGEHGHGHRRQQQGRHRDDQHAQGVVGGGLGEDDDVGAQRDRADRPQPGETAETEPERGLEERQHEQDEREGARRQAGHGDDPEDDDGVGDGPGRGELGPAARAGAGRAAGQDGDGEQDGGRATGQRQGDLAREPALGRR